MQYRYTQIILVYNKNQNLPRLKVPLTFLTIGMFFTQLVDQMRFDLYVLFPKGGTHFRDLYRVVTSLDNYDRLYSHNLNYFNNIFLSKRLYYTFITHIFITLYCDKRNSSICHCFYNNLSFLITICEIKSIPD